MRAIVEKAVREKLDLISKYDRSESKEQIYQSYVKVNPGDSLAHIPDKKLVELLTSLQAILTREFG